MSDADGPEALVAEIRANGANAVHHPADFADPDTPTALVQAANDAYGHVDIVVANHARRHRQSLETLTAAEIDLSYAVNTRATLLLLQAFAAQHDDARAGGRAILFTSGQYHGAMTEELPDIAAKAAIHELTPTLAVHLAPRGITVNCVNPGPNDTGRAEPDVVAASANRVPGGRWSTPRDTAELVGWLVTDQARWITGQVIASDGGWSALNGI